jgi:hypothetical protein
VEKTPHAFGTDIFDPNFLDGFAPKNSILGFIDLYFCQKKLAA